MREAKQARTEAETSPRQTRDRQRPLRVVVSDTERAEIKRRAEMAGMSLSNYLRTAGLNHPIRSVLDLQAVRELLGVSGDLGRLSGLLNLWLSERPGEGAPVVNVSRTLHEIRALRDRLMELASTVLSAKRVPRDKGAGG